MFLDARNREVRLASLFPRNLTPAEDKHTEDLTIIEPTGTSAQPAIRVSLRRASLNDGVEFTALSYVWGDASDTAPILVDGVEFLATKNLLAALNELQRDEETVTLWVDALCIRQTDNEEKADQIRMMKQIYEAATTTVVWLGDEADGSGDVMQMLENFAARPDIAGNTDDPSMDDFLRLGKMMLLDPAVPTDTSHPALRSIQAALKALLDRAYWFRVWCLQEFSASRNIVIACGTQRLDVEPFGKIVHHYIRLLEMVTALGVSKANLLDQIRENSPYLPNNSVGTVHGAMGMLEQRQDYRRALKERQGNPMLIDLLLHAYTSRGIDVSFRSTDPRDLVYGLLSLASDVEELGIRPDYEKTCEEVFLETWSVILQKEGAHLLVWAHGGIDAVNTPTSIGALPTWVPDWRQTRWPSNLNSAVHEGGQFIACGQAHAETKWVATDDPRVVALEGIQVDIVQESGTSFRLSSEIITTMAVFLDEIAQFLQSSASAHPDDPLYTPEALQEAAWRIPLCDLEGTATTTNPLPITRATTASEDCFRSVTAVIASYYDNTVAGVTDGATKLSMTLRQHLEKLMSYAGNVSVNNGRRPFLTPRGWVGLGPVAMVPGDIVVIFFGCRMPFVLRPCDQGRYLLLGDAYVHGLMDGEFMQVEREESAFYLC